MNDESDRKEILFVDDDPSVRDAMDLILSSGGYGVEAVASGEDALATMRDRRFDLVMTDNFMPAMSGVELALTIKAKRPSMPVVMFTGFPPAEAQRYVDLVIVKPCDMATILRSVTGMLRQA
jgi:CheY-like chemotaxis protein